jgi:hypothetical protein
MRTSSGLCRNVSWVTSHCPAAQGRSAIPARPARAVLIYGFNRRIGKSRQKRQPRSSLAWSVSSTAPSATSAPGAVAGEQAGRTTHYGPARKATHGNSRAGCFDLFGSITGWWVPSHGEQRFRKRE